MNHHRTITRLIMACMVASFIAAAGAGIARAQSTESFRATHFSVPEGDNEVPPVEEDAGYAIAIMRFNPLTSSLEYRISVALPPGQTIVAAHFHRGERGENGPPVHPITFPANSMTTTGIWSDIGSGDLAALMTQGIYLNIHTNVNQEGQLRDQVNLIPNLTAAEMSSAQETPPIPDLPGTGNAFLYLDQTQKRAVYVVDWDSLTGPPTMAHFHRGAIGQSGPPVHTIPIPSGAGVRGQVFSIWDNISDADIALLKNGGFYANIHTAQNQNGEIRAQVVNTEFYTAALSPANEVPPVTGSSGAGTGFVSLFGGREIRSFFVMDGLTDPATMGHIHNAPMGVAGSPIYNLFSFAILGYPGVWLSFTDTLSGNFHNEFRNGSMYANFHTGSFPNGEIRGQLIPSESILDLGSASVPNRSRADVPPVASWYDPSAGLLHIRTGDNRSLRGATVELYSSIGARVAVLPVGEEGGTVQAGSLATGIYFVQIVKGGAPLGTGRVAVVR